VFRSQRIIAHCFLWSTVAFGTFALSALCSSLICANFLSVWWNRIYAYCLSELRNAKIRNTESDLCVWVCYSILVVCECDKHSKLIKVTFSVLVGHLKSELDTTDLPSKKSVLSSVLYNTRFSGKRLLQSANDVTQMLVTIWSQRGISVQPHHHIIKSIARLNKDLFSLKKCLKKRRASPKHGKPFLNHV